MYAKHSRTRAHAIVKIRTNVYFRGKIGSLWEEEVYNKFRPTFQVYTFSDKMQAICEFKKWFSKKTSNSWDERHAFKTRPGMYGFVELSPATNGAGSKSKAGTSGRAAGGPLSSWWMFC